MATNEVHGALSAHPLAGAFAAEVRRVHHRYASEVVAAFSLCPFLRDVETGFGAFCVMLDREPDPKRAVEVVVQSPAVVHLVYPLIALASSPFERFAAGLSRALREALPKPPVQATFHPELSGEAVNPHRLVGLLRRAPDPFVQFIPEGLHQGGTVMAGTEIVPTKDTADVNFERLRGGEFERLQAILADVRADRDRSYAPFVASLLSS